MADCDLCAATGWHAGVHRPCVSSRREKSGCLHLQWSPMITCEHICHTWSLLRSTSRPLCASRTALGGSRQACLLVCHTTTDIRVDLRPSPASWPIRGRTARRPACFDSCSSEKLMILPGRASLRKVTGRRRLLSPYFILTWHFRHVVKYLHFRHTTSWPK